MRKINRELFEELLNKAEKNIRKRTNLNFHKSFKEKVQRLLNVMKKDTYIRPHYHPLRYRWEVFIILRGRVLVVEYKKDGKIKDFTILDEKGEVKAVELESGIYHSIIPLKDSVLYELKPGPYIEEKDKVFAPWAPEEKNRKDGLNFNKEVLKKLKRARADLNRRSPA
ncbi:MAG: cupin fold metalloprotein, WbuC family [Caldiserica bacterium]|nr:MAG: cupin fold metalloprotein, WbuC family [Caldisericota bacterium]